MHEVPFDCYKYFKDLFSKIKRHFSINRNVNNFISNTNTYKKPMPSCTSFRFYCYPWSKNLIINWLASGVSSSCLHVSRNLWKMHAWNNQQRERIPHLENIDSGRSIGIWRESEAPMDREHVQKTKHCHTSVVAEKHETYSRSLVRTLIRFLHIHLQAEGFGNLKKNKQVQVSSRREKM